MSPNALAMYESSEGSCRDSEPETMDSSLDAAAMYGYEDATPDIARGKDHYDSNQGEAAIYEYEEVAPDLYTYEENSTPSSSPISRKPSTRERRPPGQRASRRSSLKSSNNDSYSIQRRNSIKSKSFAGTEIIVNLPGSTNPVVRRASISFDKQVRVKKVKPVKALTSAPEKLWFQPDEYQAIRRKCKEIVDKVSKDTELGFEFSSGSRKKGYCIRGLETLIDDGKQARKERNKIWDTVLDEQDLQWDHGIHDEEFLAQIYRCQSKESKELASLRAQRDATEIESYIGRPNRRHSIW